MITHSELTKLLSYDRESGEFRWLVSTGNRAHVGEVAGWVSASKPGHRRRCICIRGKTYKAHHLAWFYEYGIWVTGIDHINGDGLDNAISNLRIATPSQNQMNRGKQANNTSGHVGVVWDAQHNRWRAQIKIEGRCIYLGLFDDKEEAARHRMAAVPRIHGEFGRTTS